MRIVYFASVREAIGRDSEERDLPDNIVNITDCLNWLANQGEEYSDAFDNKARLRFALDQHMAKADAALAGASELAIFPPVTGG